MDYRQVHYCALAHQCWVQEIACIQMCKAKEMLAIQAGAARCWPTQCWGQRTALVQACLATQAHIFRQGAIDLAMQSLGQGLPWYRHAHL